MMKDINFKHSEDALFLEEEHIILKEQIKKFVENEVKPKATKWEVDGYIPYMYLDDGDSHDDGKGAFPVETNPRGHGATDPQFCVPELGAREFLADIEAAKGPPLWACTRRLTVDMHRRLVIGDRSIGAQDTVETLSGELPDGPRDIITYIEYDPDKIKFFGLGDWRDPNADAEGEQPAGQDPPGDEATSRVIQPAGQPDVYILERGEDN